jgi:outer membrane protein OmpA-like peptidoglycan-associated protein
MRCLSRLLLICSLGALSLVAEGPAGAGAINLMNGVPTPAQLTEALSPPPKMRGITAKPMSEIEADRPAADLAVNFDFDSASLTPTARQILDNLATSMTSDLDSYKFELEGHTDATGTDSYNQTLSVRRADAVRAYLVEQHHVDPQRLQAVGKGEADLLDPANPAAAINRRVRVVNMGVSG